MDEVLKYAIENGMIDLLQIREKIEMNKREEIFKKHKGSVWQGKDGKWYTKLPNGDNKKLVKRSTYEKLKTAVIEYYIEQEGNTFEDWYFKWIDRQKLCGRSDNTICKYETDFDRFFSGDVFKRLNIKYITDEHISQFIARLLERKEIPWRALKGMFGYMNGVFRKAIKDKVIEENPCNYVDLLIFKKHCAEEKKKSARERTLSQKERDALIKKTKNGEKETITRLAVEFSLYVGMRAGEISALRWEDINQSDGVIIISHSEKYNRKTKEYTIEKTKNGDGRIIPITSEIEKLLLRIRKFEMSRGTLGEFVFMNNKGRLHARTISDCARNLTMSSEFYNIKSIHAIRRTLNSNMRCNGVSATVAASILGHTERVNEMNYTYDVSGNEEKRKILSAAYVSR